MRKIVLLTVIALSMMVASSCATSPAVTPPAESGSPYKPVATIKEIMDHIVDPNADELWESVATTIDANGITEKFPRTDEEWKSVRANAMALVEAPNLLMMTPRQVAVAGHKSENPGIELEPHEVQKLIDDDRASFNKLALDLQTIALEAVKAIDEKDKEKLSDVGGPIDHACEACHLKYWYPNEAKASAAQAQGKTTVIGAEPGAKEAAKEAAKEKK